VKTHVLDIYVLHFHLIFKYCVVNKR